MKRLALLVLALGLLAVASPAAAATIQSQSGIKDLQGAVAAIYQVMIVFFPGIATVYLILTGYRYIIAQGNPDLVEKAKKSLTYAVFGVIIAYSSVALVLVFSKALSFHP